MTSTVAVSPSSFSMASTETLPLSMDATPLLGAGETPTSPTATLTDLNPDGVSYPAGLSGSPVVAGNVVTQTVTALRALHSYRLAITFTAATGKVWTMVLTIDCPF